MGKEMENRRTFSNGKGLELGNSEPEANVSQFGSQFQSHVLAHQEIQPFKTIQGFLKEMARCFFACLSASTTPQQPYIFYSESPSLFKHQLMIRKLKIDHTGAKELPKPAQPTGSPAHT